MRYCRSTPRSRLRPLRRLLPALMVLLVLATLALPQAGCDNPGTIQETSQDGPTDTSLIAVPSVTPSSLPTPTGNTEPAITSESSIPIDTRPPSRQMKVRVISANVYETASLMAPVIANVPWLVEVGYVDGPDANGFSLIQTASGLRGYCLHKNLANLKAVLYASIPAMTLYSVVPGSIGPALSSQLVDVRQADPSICIDLVFASDRNFTGQKLYDRDICLLQQGTMKKLKQAQALFMKDGYSIKIYDAYRPYSVTKKLAAFLNDPKYVADPLKGSIHNKGAAVDMTVVNAQGIELEMPSLMHSMDASASCINPLMTPEARRNLDYVQSIMTQCGFSVYVHEWWHFSDNERALYPYLNLSLAYIEMVEATKVSNVKAPAVVDPVKSGYVSISPTPIPSPVPPDETAPIDTSETSETATDTEPSETGN